MLAPDARTLLLDALRPPLGMKLDRAVATTFTLDLTTALTVPLALAGFNLSGSPDVTAIMEALRSNAERIDFFAQAGMISANGWPGDLAALLEESIHTVARPRPGHLFHPKLWVMRFTAPDDDAWYRCVVSSRNLTADRSWDIILRLDSDPDVSRVNPDNDGLVRLVESLATMPGANLVDTRRDHVVQMARDLRRVWWQLPDDVENARFLAFGVQGGTRRRDLGQLFRGYRHLLISPFITADGIQLLLGDSTATELTVVSRGSELDAIGAGGLVDTDVFIMDPASGLADAEPDTVVDTTDMLGDLHAKIFVIEANKRSFVYVGSANATEAAFTGNVELVCELAGSAKALGVHTMIGATVPFRALLEPYTPAAEPVEDRKREAGRQLEAYLVDAAATGFTVSVTSGADGCVPTITSTGPLPTLPSVVTGVVMSIAPFNRPAELVAVVPDQAIHAELGARHAADVTAFLVLSAAAVVVEGIRVERSVVVRAALVGAPADRLDKVLVRQLDTPEKFLRFLMLLLALGGDAPTGQDASPTGLGSWAARSTAGLFELLVRAVAVHPDAIDRLATLVTHLQQAGPEQSVLPPGWDEVWSAINDARVLLGREVQR